MNEIKKIHLGMIARDLFQPGKEIPAADLCPKSLDVRFKEFNIQNDENTRRRFRDLLFESVDDKISGVIVQKH